MHVVPHIPQHRSHDRGAGAGLVLDDILQQDNQRYPPIPMIHRKEVKGLGLGLGLGLIF
jgi:hypothetical protein